jgi:tRNA pseudouridine38-40 synthase
MHFRYFIEFAYKGTAYHGWQLQPNAHTVQEELNNALSVLFKKGVETTGAGRTDTGVHARQMYAHFDLDISLSAEEIRKAVYQLNCILPADIAVKNILEVPADAHARFDALSRTYEYLVYMTKDPFLEGAACYLSYAPDVEEMNKAAKLLFAYEDFSAFSKSNTQVLTNNCRIMEAQWFFRNGTLVFRIKANRFLRNMVRAIVGTLLELGQGKIGEQELRAIIEAKDRRGAGTSVPAHGLYLVKIEYPFIKELQ